MYINNQSLKKSLFFLIILFSSVTICWSSPTSTFLTTLITCLILLVVISSIKNNYIRSILVSFFIIYCLFSVFVDIKYGSLSTSMVMASIGTGKRAILATIETISLWFFFFFLIAIGCIIYLSVKLKRINIKASHNLLLLLVLVAMLTKPLIDGINDWGWRFYLNNVRYDPTFISQPYLSQYEIFFGPVISAMSIKANDIVNRHVYNKVDHTSLPSYITEGSSREKNIIYIIGESSNPNRYGIYGYKENTTPYLQDLEKENKLYKLNEIHSPAAQTRLAVPMLVSFSRPKKKNDLFKYKSIIEMAKSKGYMTYWFDSQMQSNMWNKPFGFVAKYADIHLVPDGNNTEHPINEGEDFKLISYVQDYFKASSGNNLFIIHIMGNHLPYNYDGGEDLSFLSDSYDKSIYGVNQIISSIYNYAAKYLKDYTLIYVSDHGEVVNVGHGFPTDKNEMYKVPLFTNNEDVASKIESMRDKFGYFSTSNLKYIIMGLLGYNVSDNAINKAIRQSDYILDEKEKVIRFSSLKEGSG